MRTLTIIEATPIRPGFEGIVAVTLRVTPKRGPEFYLCNSMDEFIEARESKEPFVAHAVVGMAAKRIMIEPGTIERVEEV